MPRSGIRSGLMAASSSDSSSVTSERGPSALETDVPPRPDRNDGAKPDLSSPRVLVAPGAPAGAAPRSPACCSKLPTAAISSAEASSKATCFSEATRRLASSRSSTDLAAAASSAAAFSACAARLTASTSSLLASTICCASSRSRATCASAVSRSAAARCCSALMASAASPAANAASSVRVRWELTRSSSTRAASRSLSSWTSCISRSDIDVCIKRNS
mmetsp:Transcript_36809/g.96843  ORF Transcript_36809/g.96843 Transcript_36809/m.96843 type:complete len:218 (-) Transcript_36809:294-947(-)